MNSFKLSNKLIFHIRRIDLSIVTAVSVLLIFPLLSFGQFHIDKDEAIKIAFENGLEPGLEEPEATLTNKGIWEIKSLLCNDDINSGDYNIMEVDASTGKIKNNIKSMRAFTQVDGEQYDKTELQISGDLREIPVITPDNKAYKLIAFDKRVECNPVISANNKRIAFQYEYNKIGIVTINGQGFQQICNECRNPQWIGNNWIAYFKEPNRFYKKNIKTHEEKLFTNNSYINEQSQISPDFKWIAYTSSEIWDTPEPKKDSLGRIHLKINFMDGQGQELCLMSTDGTKRKFITKSGRYVNTPCWSAKSDTLYFYIDKAKCYATDLNNDTIMYCSMLDPNKISLFDYRKVVEGIFPIRVGCKIVGVDIHTSKLKYILLNEPGIYENLALSNKLKYLVFTKYGFLYARKLY